MKISSEICEGLSRGTENVTEALLQRLLRVGEVRPGFSVWNRTESCTCREPNVLGDPVDSAETGPSSRGAHKVVRDMGRKVKP